MFASLLYLVLRQLLTLVAPNHGSEDVARLEILVLRHQLSVLRRQVKRPVYRHRDRALLAAASGLLPRDRWGVFLVRPETLLRWHPGPWVARSGRSSDLHWPSRHVK
jgi:putative transposase